MRGCYPERGMDHGLFVWFTFDATEKNSIFLAAEWLTGCQFRGAPKSGIGKVGAQE